MTAELLKPAQVTVLMSTYNGGQFLQQQLDSLYAQTYPNIKILVRDDGSTDVTRDILAVEESKGAIEQLDGHINIGATRSFFTLLHHATQTETAFVAFCDQDDIWQTNKIEQAVSMLTSVSDRPALYCCRLEIVDEHLQSIKLGYIPDKIGFGNALVENIAVGCTIVLNRKAIDLLCQQQLPDDVYFHDWWCYLVLSCFGEIIFDDRALIKYRQHEKNAVGAAGNWLEGLARKFTRLFNGERWISEQAAIFQDCFAENLSSDQRELLETIRQVSPSFKYRLRLSFSTSIWRQKYIDDFILRIVILVFRI